MSLIQVNDQIVNARHETAKRYAESGIPVFPCRVNGKEPATTHGLLDRTTDIAVIDKWWSEADYNLAIVPEDAGWCVVDLDVKGDGPANWANLDGDKPETYTVATAGGGRHKYYLGSLPPSAARLAPGIDTRGRGSYVIVPPSVVDGKPYLLVDDRDLAPLPQWIADQLGPVSRAKVEAPYGLEADQPFNVDRARSFLKRAFAADGPWGEEDPPDTFTLASFMKDTGLSPEKAVEVLMEPLDEYEREWIAKTVDNAFRYGQNEPGCYALTDEVPEQWQEIAQHVAELPPEPTPAWPIIHRASALLEMQFAKPEWVWDRRILAYKPNLLTGDSGAGKTTLAENIAVAVAGGLPLLGADTRRMPVLLLVGEDEYGPVRDNLAAIRAATGAPESALEDIHVLSTESAVVPGGHVLARIADDGQVADTAFMREYLAPFLAGFDGPVLWIMDPLEEFVQFNRLNDDASRALATTWLRAVTRIGAGRVTPMVNDHPSAAGMASGRHYAGSVQMRAAFPFFSTLIAGEWSGTLKKQRKLTLKGMKARYGAEDTVEFYRTSDSPAFTVEGVPGHSPKDHARKVYEHIVARLESGERTARDNRGEYGRSSVAYALGLDERDVERAMSACRAQGWLVYEASRGQGGRDRVAAGWAPGHVTPLFTKEVEPAEY